MTEAGAATGRKPSTTFTFFSAALKLSMSCWISACPVYLIGATATVSVDGLDVILAQSSSW